MMRRERRRGEGDEVSPALLLALEVQVPSPNDCHVTWKRREEEDDEGLEAVMKNRVDGQRTP